MMVMAAGPPTGHQAVAQHTPGCRHARTAAAAPCTPLRLAFYCCTWATLSVTNHGEPTTAGADSPIASETSLNNKTCATERVDGAGVGAAANGGWSRDHEPYLGWGWAAAQRRLSPDQPLPCSWRRVAASEFESFSQDEPAIITGLQGPGVTGGGGGVWAARSRWRKAEFVRRYGAETVRVGDALEMGREGPEATLQTVTVGDYIARGMAGADGMPMYSFDRTMTNSSGAEGGGGTETEVQRPPGWLVQHIGTDYQLPPVFGGDGAGGWRHRVLNLGPSGEGLGFHYHDAAINSVVFGAKRWWVCPNYMDLSVAQFESLKVLLGGEATSFGQNIRMRDWLRDVYPAPEVQAAIGAAGMSECTQRAGETVFVPAGWHHAVLNLGEVISLAVQKSGPGGAFEGQAAAAAGAGAPSEAEAERGG
jgi:hypothetical protein